MTKQQRSIAAFAGFGFVIGDSLTLLFQHFGWDMRILVFITLSVAAGWWIFVVAIPDMLRGNIGQRPLIYVWMHNGVTAVADEESYLEVINTVPTGTLRPQPEPTHLAYFTDDPEARELLGKYYTGSNAELNEFASWCRVERTEMLVRRIPRGTPVDLATLQFVVGEGIVTIGMHH
jgi:hypothetical protein